ncbi:hypothetical protein L3Q82_017414, partial [Scortum barcoo]
ERLVAGSLPTGPGRAQPEMATWARLPVGSPPAGRSMRGRCNVVWVAVVAGGLGRPNPWTKTLAIGTWNVTWLGGLGGKEPELVREVERYRLEIVGLTSTHSLGSGTQLLERAGPSTTLELPRQYRVPKPSWSPWEGYLIVLRLGTPLFYWGTSSAHVGKRQ